MVIQKHIIFSAHLDDSVFSCGGLLAKVRAKHQDAEVITFFQKQPNLEEIPKGMRIFADYSQRREENRQALQFLDVKITNLNYAERAFVPPFLKLTGVFFAPKGGIKEFQDYDLLIQEIERITDANDSQECMFYCPLGIGGHYDHLRLFFASIAVMERRGLTECFKFYEDGYAIMGNPIRKKHPIARQVFYPPMQDMSKISLKGFILTHGMSMMIKTRSVDSDYLSLLNRYTWTVQLEDITDVLTKKFEAYHMYPSQLAGLGGESLFMAWAKRYHTFWNNCEPYWIARKK